MDSFFFVGLAVTFQHLLGDFFFLSWERQNKKEFPYLGEDASGFSTINFDFMKKFLGGSYISF